MVVNAIDNDDPSASAFLLPEGANVFPLPVFAMPMTSLPAAPMAQVWASRRALARVANHSRTGLPEGFDRSGGPLGGRTTCR